MTFVDLPDGPDAQTLRIQASDVGLQTSGFGLQGSDPDPILKPEA
jgi:hypothetical protein